MYWATSFWEREHSSKRAWMYFERLWCSLVPSTGGCSGVLVAARFICPLLFDVPLPHSSMSPHTGDRAHRPVAWRRDDWPVAARGPYPAVGRMGFTVLLEQGLGAFSRALDVGCGSPRSERGR